MAFFDSFRGGQRWKGRLVHFWRNNKYFSKNFACGAYLEKKNRNQENIEYPSVTTNWQKRKRGESHKSKISIGQIHRQSQDAQIPREILCKNLTFFYTILHKMSIRQIHRQSQDAQIQIEILRLFCADDIFLFQQGQQLYLKFLDENRINQFENFSSNCSMCKSKSRTSIREFPLYQTQRFRTTTQPKCCGIAISSCLSKFSLFFSKPPESSKYLTKLVDLSTRSRTFCGSLYARRPKNVL